MTEQEKMEEYVKMENGETSETLSPEEKAKKEDIMARIEHTLNKIRPYLQAEGGDVSLIDFADGVATVSMNGACSGCMMASIDVSDGVEALVVDEVPEVMHVRLAPVTNQYYY